MHILFDGNINNPEIEISNSCKELINFGNQLINIDKDIKIKSKDKKSKFYPKNIKYLYVKVTNYKEKENLIKFVLMGEKLICEGTKYAFLKLGQQYPACSGRGLR